MSVRSENSTITAPPTMTFDHERLRLVTENSRELQHGLTWVTLGAAFLIIVNTQALDGKGHVRPVVEAFSVLGVLAFLASLIYAPRYYRSRFGWIEQRPDWPDPSLNLILGRVVYLLVYAVTVFGHLFKHVGPRGLDFTPLALLASVVFYQSLSRPQLASLRLPYLIPAIAIMAGVTLFPMWRANDDSQLVFWRTLNWSLFPFFLLVMGIGVHILLLRLIPKRAQKDEDDE